MQKIGWFNSGSIYIASTGQARAQSPHPVHLSLRRTTPPPFLCLSASSGQARAQGAGLQARQTRASKPVLSPPDERIWIPALFQEMDLCTSRAQAREQE